MTLEFYRSLNSELTRAIIGSGELIAQRGTDGMETMSYYIARRFCTSCMTQWGDVDVLLDLASGMRPRTKVFMELKKAGKLPHMPACCHRAVLCPTQHNIGDYMHYAVSEIGTVGELNVAKTVIAKRTRFPNRKSRNSEDVLVLSGKPDLKKLENMMCR